MQGGELFLQYWKRLFMLLTRPGPRGIYREICSCVPRDASHGTE